MTELRLPKPPKELIKLEIAYLRECYAVAKQTRDNGKPLYNARQLCKYKSRLIGIRFGLRKKLQRSVIMPCEYNHHADRNSWFINAKPMDEFYKKPKKQIGANNE